MIGYKTPTWFLYDISVEEDGDIFVTKMDPNYARATVLLRVDSIKKLKEELLDYGVTEERINDLVKDLEEGPTIQVLKV